MLRAGERQKGDSEGDGRSGQEDGSHAMRLLLQVTREENIAVRMRYNKYQNKNNYLKMGEIKQAGRTPSGSLVQRALCGFSAFFSVVCDCRHHCIVVAAACCRRAGMRLPTVLSKIGRVLLPSLYYYESIMLLLCDGEKNMKKYSNFFVNFLCGKKTNVYLCTRVEIVMKAEHAVLLDFLTKI